MAAQIKGIVFDKDGTLFDLHQTWAGFCEAFLSEVAGGNARLQMRLAERLGYDAQRQMFQSGSLMVGGTAQDIFDVVGQELGLEDHAPLHRLAERLSRDLPDLPIHGLEDALGTLKTRGLWLGVATNDYESVAHQQLGRSGLDPLFDFVAGADSGHGGKPGPGMILAFCKQFGLTPDQVAMVGDSTHDLAAGRAARVGLNVGVLTGAAGKDDLSDMADVVLPDVTHLVEYLSP